MASEFAEAKTVKKRITTETVSEPLSAYGPAHWFALIATEDCLRQELKWTTAGGISVVRSRLLGSPAEPDHLTRKWSPQNRAPC
jgi:hypothetical protein